MFELHPSKQAYFRLKGSSSVLACSTHNHFPFIFFPLITRFLNEFSREFSLIKYENVSCEAQRLLCSLLVNERIKRVEGGIVTAGVRLKITLLAKGGFRLQLNENVNKWSLWPCFANDIGYIEMLPQPHQWEAFTNISSHTPKGRSRKKQTNKKRFSINRRKKKIHWKKFCFVCLLFFHSFFSGR